ncbi:IucA/IucC family protein [Legionella quateirensis]|uniref:Siderophore biosynthetic enzyme FrgA n=1 Tax=Legionella quateirensis TaxID=45072 RepID=A0A378KXU3_9GAMM|nr:IucA/IucC family protein [Legionella quateirensis]KTD46243.1 siderophore biosynthetic enzyme FrgA [Legionella quateirensis]STY18989.1 siderophore biosynthetic enzyme FrgA [Legionella quateirensis]
MNVNSTSSQEVNHPLHSVLIENGLHLSPKELDEFIDTAYQDCFSRLQHAAISEYLIESKTTLSSIHHYLNLLKNHQKKLNQLSLFNRWSSLEQELEESILNQALALAYHQHWQQTIKIQAKNYSTLWAWLIEHHDRQDVMMFMEQWGCTGHPYHPNFRVKKGFSLNEVLHYSPEFNTQVSIHWAAIHRSLAFTSIDELSYRLLFAQHFAQEFQYWNQTLLSMHLDPDHYLPLPVHPWQCNNKLKTLCSSLIESRQFIIIPDIQKTRPSMSFRTMMPLEHNKPHLKLAVGVHTTSAMRTVSPASVYNSSVLSTWLSDLLARHQNFGGALFIARDLAGINVSDQSIPAQDKKHVAMLIRENPLQHTNEQQFLVPLAALFATSPVSQLPLLIEIIQSSTLNPRTYFSEYCHSVLAGQLYLLLRYGIALEAHQQNTLIKIQNNRPVGVVIRDLGGIKVCYHELYHETSKPVLHPESTITCSELNSLSQTFIHGTLLSNLSPWITSLNAAYGYPLDHLWLQVRTVLKGLLELYRAEIHPAVYRWHYQHLLSMPWQHKSLLTMRLNQDQDEPNYFSLHNPLSTFND